MTPEMKSNLDLVCAQIEKTFGRGSIMTLNDKPAIDPDGVISTGSIGLDIALGIGGYAKGRIIEIFGMDSAGKSTLCLHAIANAQKKGLACVYIDQEHALDKNYAAALGVDLDKMLISQPDFAEQALGIMDLLIKSGEVGLIVVDSVASLIPQKELEGEMGDQIIGLQARLMSQAMRKIAGVCDKTGCSVIFTNQIRHKVATMGGSPNTVAGGLALRFYASQRLEIIRIGDIKDKDNIIGNRTKVKVIKNKLAPPKKEVEFSIIFGRGVDPYLETLELAAEDGLIQKAGSWYKYEGASVGQGQVSTIAWLKENEEIYLKIRKELREARGLD
jgi:recombination protein RecA